MGLPALIIPEGIIEDLEVILKSQGLKTERLPQSGDSIQRNDVPNFELSCFTDEKEKLVLGFGRTVSTPHHLVVTFRGVPSAWWKFKTDSRLLKQVESILIEHGATELPQKRK